LSTTFVEIIRDEVVVLGHLEDRRVVRVLCLVEHITLDGLQDRGDRILEIGQRNGVRDARVAADGESLLLSEVIGADLETAYVHPFVPSLELVFRDTARMQISLDTETSPL